MDKSETYIKMCEKAYPIIGNREPCARDYWMICDGDNTDVMIITDYPTDSGCYGPGVGIPGDMYGWEPLFPIWRQDQLQEMVIEDTGSIALIFVFNYWFYNADIDEDSSMEQLWLAFVMKEKYGKVWNGEEWINA